VLPRSVSLVLLSIAGVVRHAVVLSDI